MRVDIAGPLLAETLVYEFGVPNVDVKRDMVFCAGEPGRIQAVGCMRPVVLVQGLVLLDPLPPSRRLALARTLSAFAQGYIRGRQFAPQGCIFQVSPGNSTMETFAHSIGAEQQAEGSKLYRIDYA